MRTYQHARLYAKSGGSYRSVKREIEKHVMAEAAANRSYEYIAITDHSKTLKIAGGIDESALKRQGAEITKVNVAQSKSVPHVTVLRSIEMNLNPRGEGDMSSNNIDVVLCDIGLPDGSGFEVAAQARAKGHIKAIALTGFGTEQDIQRSKDAGFDFHLVKPINFQELQSVLEQHGE